MCNLQNTFPASARKYQVHIGMHQAKASGVDDAPRIRRDRDMLAQNVLDSYSVEQVLCIPAGFLIPDLAAGQCQSTGLSFP